MRELDRLVTLYNSNLPKGAGKCSLEGSYDQNFASFLVSSVDPLVLAEVLLEYKSNVNHDFETSDFIASFDDLPLYDDVVKKQNILDRLSYYISKVFVAKYFNNKERSKTRFNDKQDSLFKISFSENFGNDFSGNYSFYNEYEYKVSFNNYSNVKEVEVKRLINTVRICTNYKKLRNFDTESLISSQGYEQLKSEYLKFVTWKVHNNVNKSRYDIVESCARSLIDSGSKKRTQHI